MIEIYKKKIINSERPYILVELSSNHNCSIIKVTNSIKVSKKCSADAIKIQTYSPDSMRIDIIRKELKM